MKATDLDILLQEGEGVMLEYKERFSSSFARELVVFANTAGGRILLGVQDDGTIKRIADTNELRVRIQDIGRNCDPPVKILLQRTGEVTVVTVRERDANPAVRAEAGIMTRPADAQAGTKLALSWHQVKILRKCREDSLLVDLMIIAERSDRTKFRKQVLNPLMDKGLLEMTVAEKPRISKQRYRTTPSGLAVLANAEKETHS
jgi:predicted HTH transcriptional regulator